METETEQQAGPEFFIHLQPQGALLVEKRSMYYFRLSGEAVEIALLLARNKSIRRTANILSMTKGSKITEEDLLAQLSAHPLTDTWKNGIEGKLSVYGSTRSYVPISCTLQLTNGCNLSCSFCYASSGKRLENELATDEWLQILKKLAAVGVNDVTLTGGEARLAKGFKHILTAASSLFTSVHLFSNGLNWRDDEIELIQNLGNVFVQVSIDGTPEIHNLLRERQGAYEETFNNIKRMASAHINCLVAMTVNPKNFHTVKDVVKDSVNAGARIFRAGITLPVGRAEGFSFGLTDEQYSCVNQQLKESSRLYGDQIYISNWEEDDHDGCTDFCTPGYLQWYIRADGVVTPCQVESESLGHILRDSIGDIGNPERLKRIKETAKSCNCIRKVKLPEDVDLPYVYTGK
ncbi:sporulation killing factor system radical SAM maturase [Paenibacillus larvae subsp. pulvifaciens]|uniref:Sporulation killing factor system radical SAM maturase n=1 Tax=Paenibacillus larvae subsp. pulvifaciens TaxID=1477 RepID=A0A1V0US39_9BACL|nr:sporulation killing factor system radical SAM maturase [Paenibacillus larvae]ARF68113.1 sporulation killing factor system radical SAM maturase [Paenibacillus larvae subsp. pulvifaciens]